MDTATPKKKILIIDDEESIVQYLEMLLQDNGYETFTARDGVEGMTMTEQEMPDLICLDITMPEKSGVRFYKELRENPDISHIKVVVVTAVTYYGGDSEPFEKFLASRSQFPPPDRFMSKPIDRDEFLKVVEDLLATSDNTAS